MNTATFDTHAAVKADIAAPETRVMVSMAALRLFG